jgi:hypothetical protein
MKNIFKISTMLLLLALMNSCSKDWLDVNHDPNYPETTTVQLAFPSAVASTAAEIGGQYNILGSIWCQYWTQSNAANQYKSIDQYQMLQSSLNRQYNGLYAGALKDYKYVRETSLASKNWSFYLMATVMEAYTYQMLADLYDQIPFREACLGDKGITTPHFDDGQLVYDSIIARIDTALAKDFSAKTVTNPGTADFLFQGDMSYWAKFANTLKLKIYLREMYARPEVAKAGIEALFNDPNGFLDADAAMTQFVDQPDKDNPLYEDNNRALNVATNLRASATFLFYLQKNQDTRLPFLFGKGSSNAYVALGQGDFNVSNIIVPPELISVGTIKATDPVYFISTAESYFLQAEAVAFGIANGWNLNYTDDDKTLYENGVAAAFAKYGLDATDFLAAGGAYEYPSSSDFNAKQEAIITQKWVSMAGCEGLEMFFEHNRTHFPKENFAIFPTGSDHITKNPAYVGLEGTFVKPANAVISSFPQRLLFPDSERQRNPNTPAEKAITEKVWWNKK